MSNVIESELYGGKVKVRFFPDSHQYWINGQRKSGVTSVLNILDKSRFLIPWAVELYSDYLQDKVGQPLTEEMIAEGESQHTIKKQEAANVGTLAHEFIESFVKGNKPDMPEDKNVLQAVNGFLKWVDNNKVKFISSEKIVYSKKHDFVGQMDATATFNGKRKKFVIDYKVSKGLYPSVAMQTAAYLMADTEESGTEYEGRWAIRLAKETEEEYIIREEKKLSKWCKKNADKTAYSINPYVPFEAKYLDAPESKVDRDYQAFLAAQKLSGLSYEIGRDFFSFK